MILNYRVKTTLIIADYHDNSGKEMQSGAVLPTVAISIMALILCFGLAYETFRMYTARLQLQNIAENIAEQRLRDMLSKTNPIPLHSTYRIDRIVEHANKAIAIDEDIYGPITEFGNCTEEETICYSQGCLAPDPITNSAAYGTFTHDILTMVNEVPTYAQAPCPVGQQKAVLNTIATNGGYTFVGDLLHIFGIDDVHISTQVIARLKAETRIDPNPPPNTNPEFEYKIAGVGPFYGTEVNPNVTPTPPPPRRRPGKK